MPMCSFLYADKLYEKYIANNEYYVYINTLQPAQRPKCICFYNGAVNQPEHRVQMSDAFGDWKVDIEVVITMLNINYDKNKALMEACSPLNEYAMMNVDKQLWICSEMVKHQAKSRIFRYVTSRGLYQRNNSTIYIKRYKVAEARRTVSALQRTLSKGSNVCVPEQASN